MLCAAPLYPSVQWQWSLTLQYFLHLLHIYIQIFLCKYNMFLHFHIILAALLLIASFFPFKINYYHCIQSSANFFIKSLPLYTSCLYSMLLNEDITVIEKPVPLLLFWINFQDYFYIHQYFLLYIRVCMKTKWCFTRFLKLIKL